MPRGAWTQYLFIILVVGFSLLSWIIRKLQEQSAKRQIEERRQRQIEDALRTGRVDGEGEAASAEPRERVAAERRRAQIEELRRRARERGARAGQASAQGPIIMIPGSSGPIVIQTDASARAPAQPRPQRRPQGGPRQRERSREQALPEARTSRAEPKRRPPAPQPQDEPVFQRATAPPEQPEPARHARPAIRGKPLSGADWQQAVILREVLGPPVSLRAPDGAF